MSDLLVLKHVESQVIDGKYTYVLYTYTPDGRSAIAVDRFIFSEESQCYEGWRETGEMDEEGSPYVELVIAFPEAAPFMLVARSEFRSLTQNQYYEEQLEYDVEAKRFGERAKKHLNIPDKPTEY